MIRHRLQTVFPVAAGHSVVVRSGWRGGWDVVEITPTGSTVRDHLVHRAAAEVIADAIAATRTPTQSVTAVAAA